MKIEKVLLVYAKPTSKIQEATIDSAKKALEKNNVDYYACIREKLNKRVFKNKDLILAVGGDGTFLIASHYVFGKTPMMGINSEPSSKEGFFMNANKNDFGKKLKRVIDDKFKIKKLHRLEAYIGKKRIP